MGKNFRRILLTGVFVIGLWANTITGLAAELTVTVGAAKIRAEASTASEVVGSTEMGKKFASAGETTDSSGQVWYKVPIGGNNYGYIRSDLVEVSGGGTSTATEATVATPIEPRAATISQRSTNVRTGASLSHAQIVSLSMDTAITVVGEAPSGDGDNRVWYEVTANVNGEEIKGFVREDMVNLGEVLPPAEGESTEPVPTEGEEAASGENDDSSMPVSADDDFFISQEPNEQGENTYYLNNRIAGGKLPAQYLWELPETARTDLENAKKDISKGRTIIIILMVIIFILALVVTVLIFKIRDLYDYEDEEEDLVTARRKTGPGFGGFGKSREPAGRPGEAPPGRVRRSGEPGSGQGRRSGETGTGQGRRPGETGTGQGRRQGEPPAGQPRRSGEPTTGQNRRPGEPSAGQNRRPGEPSSGGPRRQEDLSSGGPRRQGEPPAGVDRPFRDQEGQRVRRSADPELRAAERSNRPERPDDRPAPARKPQNFLHDDDEFEFEFLNMDDKE